MEVECPFSLVGVAALAVHQTDSFISKNKDALNALEDSEPGMKNLRTKLEVAICKSSELRRTHPEIYDSYQNICDVPAVKGDSFPPEGPQDEKLGDKFVRLWHHRRSQLITDLSIAAWFLSPHDAVREDVNRVMDLPNSEFYEEALERCFCQIMVDRRKIPSDEFDMRKDTMLAQFQEELQAFRDKTGHCSKSYIWKSSLIVDNCSAQWHNTHSRGLLKKFGARVCSKIVGIGSAERVWRYVKFNKQGQR